MMVTHDFTAGVLLTMKGHRHPLSTQKLNSEIVDAAAMHRASCIGDGQKLLLMFAWVTNEELRLIFMHPECIAFDVTHQTNNQKKNLLVGCFKDGDNKVFHACHAFIPNQRRSTFSLFFSVCLPKLLGRSILNRVHCVMTDGDSDLYLSIENSIRSKMMPNAVLGRCVWHLFHLGWRGTITAKKKSNLHSAESELYHWIESWMNWEGKLCKAFLI